MTLVPEARCVMEIWLWHGVLILECIVYAVIVRALCGPPR